MKRFWHTCLAMIATATMTAGVANAQNNWNAPSEIGSYQSILSRAGYGQETNIATATRQVASQVGAVEASPPLVKRAVEASASPVAVAEAPLTAVS